MAESDYMKAALDALFERIDRELGDDGVPVPSRLLHASGRVHDEIGAPLRLIDRKTGRGFLAWRNGKIGPLWRAEEVFEPWPTDHISLRLDEWYRETYGDRLNQRFDVGEIVIRIRGALWRTRICQFFGKIRLYCAIETEPSPKMRVGNEGPGVSANVLDVVEGLPEALRRTLTRDELLAIFETYQLGFDAYFVLTAGAARSALIPAALRDHSTAVDALVGDRPHFGQSKWASLQAAEKTLKAVLETKGEPIPKGRDGHDLAAVAQKVIDCTGLTADLAPIAKRVQCDAGARYGEADVTMDEALDAHHAALEVARACGDVLGSGATRG